MYTATSLTTALLYRTGSTPLTVSSAHRPCTLSSCAVVSLLSVHPSSVLSRSAAVSSTCGSAGPAPVSCSTWVSKQQRRARSTRTYTSTCLNSLLYAANNSLQDIRFYHRFLRRPVPEQHPWPFILLQLDFFCWCRLDPPWLHNLLVLLVERFADIDAIAS
jgi:hypothetical protein